MDTVEVVSLVTVTRVFDNFDFHFHGLRNFWKSMEVGFCRKTYSESEVWINFSPKLAKSAGWAG